MNLQPDTPASQFEADLVWFPVRVTSVLGGGQYVFQEVWQVSGGAVADKIGGRFNTSLDPAYAIDGSTFAVTAAASAVQVLARRSPGSGGVQWELKGFAASASGSFFHQNFNDTFGSDAYDVTINGGSPSFSTGAYATTGAFVTATGYIDRFGVAGVQQRIGIMVLTSPPTVGLPLPAGMVANGWIVVDALADKRTNFMVGGAIRFVPGTYSIGCAVENVSGTPPTPSGGVPALPVLTNISIQAVNVT